MVNSCTNMDMHKSVEQYRSAHNKIRLHNFTTDNDTAW